MYIYVYLFTCVPIYICVRMYVHLRACMFIYVYICLWICVCVCDGIICALETVPGMQSEQELGGMSKWLGTRVPCSSYDYRSGSFGIWLTDEALWAYVRQTSGTDIIGRARIEAPVATATGTGCILIVVASALRYAGYGYSPYDGPTLPWLIRTTGI